MTTADLLSRRRAHGVALAAGDDGALLREADDDPPADVLADLAGNKAAVLDLHARPSVQTSAQLLDSTTADTLLAEWRPEVAHDGKAFSDQPPTPFATLLADVPVIVESYDREHGAAAAHGWDSLEFPRG